MLPFGLLFDIFDLLLCPSILISLHSLVEPCIIKSILFITILLSFGSIVDIMVFIESLFFYNFIDALQLTWRVDCYYGLKMRLPAVWNLDWNPTTIQYNDTPIIQPLSLNSIPIHILCDILLEYNVCVTHTDNYFLYIII